LEAAEIRLEHRKAVVMLRAVMTMYFIPASCASFTQSFGLELHGIDTSTPASRTPEPESSTGS
jgi:hypothetical protein